VTANDPLMSPFVLKLLDSSTNLNVTEAVPLVCAPRPLRRWAV